MFKKLRENSLRRKAKQQRLRPVKSRPPEPEANYSSWRWPDLYFNLDQVEAALSDWRKRTGDDP